MSDRFGLMEATKRYAKKSLTSKVEKDLERDMGKAFIEQGLVMAKGFARLSYLFSEAVGGKALDPLFDAAEAATFGVMEGGMNDASVKALALGHQALAAEMGMQLSFDVANPYAAAYLQAHGAAMVTNINETTRTAIQGLVTEGVENGWSYTKTAEELIHKYKEFAIGKPQEHIDGRAHLIAITETGNAYMEGQFALMDTMAGMGLPMEKAWVTMGDDRVSDECEENESAGWIAFDDPFPSGDMHPLRFPGCRCDMEERMAEVTGEEEAPIEQVLSYTPDLGDMLQVAESQLEAVKNQIAYEGLNITPEEYLSKAVANLQEQVDANPVCIRTSGNAASRILSEQRFKTQFEVGDSGGYYAPAYRKSAEQFGLGAPYNLDDELRPVYGYVRAAIEYGEELDQYGNIEWVLANAVKDRATITAGDSLAMFANTNGVASPAARIAKECLGNDFEYVFAKDWKAISYIEAQIQGQVALDDVSEILIHAYGASESSLSGATEAFINRAREMGFKVKVVR